MSRSYTVSHFSLDLDFENFKDKTGNELVKKRQKRNLIEVLTTRKVSLQADQHNLHYVPGKHGLNKASLSRPRRNPSKFTQNKNFPSF